MTSEDGVGNESLSRVCLLSFGICLWLGQGTGRWAHGGKNAVSSFDLKAKDNTLGPMGHCVMIYNSLWPYPALLRRQIVVPPVVRLTGETETSFCIFFNWSQISCFSCTGDGDGLVLSETYLIYVRAAMGVSPNMVSLRPSNEANKICHSHPLLSIVLLTFSASF